MRKAAPALSWLLPREKLCLRSASTSSGVDNLRQVLRQLGQGVGLDSRAAPNGGVGGGSAPPTTNHDGDGVSARDGSGGTRPHGDFASVLGKSAVLVKELLRIFTRRVPGGLVPDGLVRGFMQAYSELEGPQERLAFFRLVSHEMGLSVAEVSAAVHLWDAVQARPSPSPVPSPSAEAGGAQSHTPPRLPSAASTDGGGGGLVEAAPSPDAAYRVADRISSACRPLYSQLFLPISQAPQGIKFLMDLRADLLRLAADPRVAASPGEAAPLRFMADNLRQSLAEWFSVGLLHLQPISWEESPAALLERVMRYEAVHPLGSWEELRRRLGPRRRVFAFTHPCVPGEPLVVLHTALMCQPPAAMSDILEGAEGAEEETWERGRPRVRLGPHPGRGVALQPPPAPAPAPAPALPAASHSEEPPGPVSAPGPLPPPPPPPPPPSTAVFYSISSSQPGLRGIDLGQFLIKRVAERLMAENPSIRRLVTLSPLPNFRSWLISRLRQEQSTPPSLPPPAAAPSAQQDGDGGSGGAGGGGGGGGGGGDAPLLRPAEADEVVRLARAMGWETASFDGDGGGGAGAAAAPVAPSVAEAALCWLLEGDRWLLEDRRGKRAGGEDAAASSAAGAFAAGGSAEAGPAEAVLRLLLLRLAARYLVAEKRRRFALCPVAHFHLRNGASLRRLNWRADTSPLGLSRSCGIMVNYEYELPCVYDNNWKYIMLHEVQAHPQVTELLR